MRDAVLDQAPQVLLLLGIRRSPGTRGRPEDLGLDLGQVDVATQRSFRRLR